MSLLDPSWKLIVTENETGLPPALFDRRADPGERQDLAAEDRRLEREYLERNRQTAEMLRAKGFDRFTINMALHAGLDKSEGDA